MPSAVEFGGMESLCLDLDLVLFELFLFFQPDEGAMLKQSGRHIDDSLLEREHTKRLVTTSSAR